MIILALVN